MSKRPCSDSPSAIGCYWPVAARYEQIKAPPTTVNIYDSYLALIDHNSLNLMVYPGLITSLRIAHSGAAGTPDRFIKPAIRKLLPTWWKVDRCRFPLDRDQNP